MKNIVVRQNCTKCPAYFLIFFFSFYKKDLSSFLFRLSLGIIDILHIYMHYEYEREDNREDIWHL